MARSLLRFLLVVGAIGVVHAAFVGCGSSDETKWTRPDGEGGEGGAAGDPGAGTGARAAGSANGGSSGSANGGSSGRASGGSAGEPAGESGAGGAPSGAGGESAAGGVPLVGAGGDGGGGGEPSGCVPVPGSRITIGFDASNAEWVKNLQWLDSANVLSANLAASSTQVSNCGDPVEFFGQSYGAPEGTTPLVVYAGSRATAVSCGLDVTISSTPNNCNAAAQIPWQTEYHFYGGAKASQMRVTRSFGFDENTPKFTGGLRPWQPRVPLATLPTVIYPNESGTAVTTTSASSWPNDHFVATGSTWNGQWFADIAANGLALIVRRDPSMTSAVSLTINWDSFSSSNLTSFVLTQPDVGWQSPITEVEYVCFADLTSWPQAQRDAATLPSWCGP